VREFSTRHYNAINSIPPGANTLFTFDFGAADVARQFYTEIELQHLIQLQAKIIMFTSTTAVAATVGETVIDKIDWASLGYQYGVDYVFLGWLPGGETMLSALATDFQSVLTTDYYGTPTSQLPILQGIEDESDIDIFIANGGFSSEIAHWWYNKPGERILTGFIGFEFYPDISVGYLWEMPGSAEYEFLTGIPGEGIKITDVISLVLLSNMLYMLIGNIAYRLRGKTAISRTAAIVPEEED
jgi:hypothetical protein